MTLLLLLSSALAAEPGLYWSPTEAPAGAQVGATGLAIGDFDGDGTPDLCASVLEESGITGLILDLSSTGQHHVEFEFEDIGVRAASVDMEEDGQDELLLWFPEGEDGKGEVGLLSPAITRDGELGGLYLFGADHDAKSAMFSDGLALADLDADGVKEFLIGAPGLPAGVVYAFDYVPKTEPDLPDAAATWSSEDGLEGIGAEILARPEQGDIVVALCDYRFGESTCTGGGGLTTLRMDDWQGGSQLIAAADVLPGGDEVPLALLSLPDPDGEALLVWAGATEKTLISETARAALTLTASGTGVTMTTTPDGSGVLWVQDDGVVYAIREPSAGSAADQADATFSVSGASLGAQLTAADDVDGDGCQDLFAATDLGTIYLLPGLCDVEVVTDTGDTGALDTSDPDTAPLLDSGDTGEVCAGGLGWSCSTGGSVAVLWVGLLAVLRRR